jgi:GT2 family glycosyltransferase/glycosyltransferase involved in cell wall biosynthesis
MPRGLVVVIVAYGVPDLLRECLAGLEGKYRTIVVDNSSSAAVRDIVNERGASYIDPGRNLGFSAGVNRALGELDLRNTDVLLLNPDSTIDPVAIDGLRARLAGGGRLACVAPSQRRRGSAVEERVGWPFPTPLGAWIEAIGLGALRRRHGFAIGAVLLFRGEALVEVGGFDERFFLYAEETDWQRRARRLGWGTAICREIWATHIGAASDADAHRRELRFHTGAERYVRKYHGRLGWTSYRLANIAGATARAIALRGERRRAAAGRAWIYMRGPDRVARKAGAVPPPVSRVPDLSGNRGLMEAAPMRRGGRPPLRVLLDARDLGINRKGVGRVLEEVVPRLVQLDPDRYVAVATPAGRQRLAAMGSDQVGTMRHVPQSLWEQLVLPMTAAVLGVDAIYSHRECAALWGPPVLLHVTEDPEIRWGRQIDPAGRERVRRGYSHLFMDRSLQRARVVASTESTRSDLVRRHGLRPEQVSVVALGVDHRRFAASGATTRGTSQYFFCLGSDDPRDNCELVLEAFARFLSESDDVVALVLAGDLHDQTRRIEALSRHLGVEALVDMPGRITDAQLSARYAQALATICVSNNEGFGLQPLEALACGSLLIAGRTAAVEEVTRGATVLWTDLEVGSLAAAMTTVVKSPGLREAAATANPAVAARFDWSVTAVELHQLLEELAFASVGVRRRHRSRGRTCRLQP